MVLWLSRPTEIKKEEEKKTGFSLKTCGRISQILNSVNHVQCHITRAGGMKDIFDGGTSHGHVCITNGLHLTELYESVNYSSRLMCKGGFFQGAGQQTLYTPLSSVSRSKMEYMELSIETTSIGLIRLHISVNVTTSLNRIVTHSKTW